MEQKFRYISAQRLKEHDLHYDFDCGNLLGKKLCYVLALEKTQLSSLSDHLSSETSVKLEFCSVSRLLQQFRKYENIQTVNPVKAKIHY